MINKKSVIAGAITGLAISNAYAENSWYVGGSIGEADVSDVNTTSAPIAGVARTIDVESDSDIELGAKIGRTLYTTDTGHEFSLELSYAGSEHDVENIAFLGTDFFTSDGAAEGSVYIDTILLRAVYKFNLGNFDPYVGIGIGQSDFEFYGRYGPSVGQRDTPPFSDGDEGATAVQYRIGLEYGFTEDIGLFVEFTQTDVDDIDFLRVGSGPGGPATTIQEGDFDFDTFSVGANYRF